MRRRIAACFGLRRLVSASELKGDDMISVTFPDGAQRQFEPGITGFDIAKGISPSLAKRTVAMSIDGTLLPPP